MNGSSPFPPIADYAFLSNCHTGALVAPDGSIDWLCIPSFDAPSVFASLLDRQAGSFRFGPIGINHPSARAYEPGTNVLVTTWKTPSGWVVVRDALTMGPYPGEDSITPHTRPPTDYDAEHMLVRTVVCIEGQVGIDLVCEPSFDYGRTEAEWTLADGDPHTADASGAGQTFRLRSSLALGIEGGRVRGRHRLEPGERAYCALSWAKGLEAPADVEDAEARVAATTRFWRSWIGRARLPDHHFSEAIQRSALAIKGLTYMPTGATVAAPTTSLPETPGGERNWDYRYTWMRDSTFTLQALHWLNLDMEADEFIQFIADLEPTEDGSLQIMYGIDGRRDLTESIRDDLSGYEGARPVRIGNGAFDQRQNDVYGMVLDSILLHTRRSQRLPRRLWPIVESQAECASGVWRKPDQGIWEARGEPQHYVSSKLMCWVALDRAAKLAEIRGDPELAARMTPWYNYLCKRPLFSDDFLETLNKPNVTVVDTDGVGVTKIDETSVHANGKAYEVDCIIFATGFDVAAAAHKVGGYELVGRDGLTVDEKWKNGMRTVHGMQMHGFPNFYVVGGIAQGTTSFNYTHALQMQASYAVDIIGKCVEDGIRTIEVTPEAEDRWLEKMKTPHKIDLVAYYRACTPGFLNHEGDVDGQPTFLGSTYGGGALEYNKIITEWRSGDQMTADCDVTYESESVPG